MDSLIIFAAKYLFAGVVLILLYVWLMIPKNQRLQMAAVVILAGILALIISRIGGKFYYDPRPFVTHNVKPLISHAPDNGFPSDHALLTMTLTAVLYFYSRRWAAAALILTILVGVARVAAHIHSPIDIIGAWLMGIIAAAAAFYLIDRTAWFKPRPQKLPQDS